MMIKNPCEKRPLNNNQASFEQTKSIFPPKRSQHADHFATSSTTFHFSHERRTHVFKKQYSKKQFVLYNSHYLRFIIYLPLLYHLLSIFPFLQPLRFLLPWRLQALSRQSLPRIFPTQSGLLHLPKLKDCWVSISRIPTQP